MAHFQIPLNLPHAGTISGRMEYYIRGRINLLTDEHRALLQSVNKLQELLGPIRAACENPPDLEAQRVVGESAELGRRIVDGIDALNLGNDRLGQAIRNLFECLERGEEGAQLSLRAGENPDSALRAT